jgi:hypothetical protein
MPSAPRISVVIPAYNAAEFIEETLESIRKQSLPAEQIEVIVANDGSTDDTLDVLQEYQRTRMPALTILDLPNSGSAAAPRNAGLAAANGEFVHFVDADDLLHPLMFQDILRLADETGSDIVLSRMVNFGDGERSIPRRVFEKERRAEDFIETYAYRTLGPWKLFRRELLVREGLTFPAGYRNGEDQPFVMGAYLAANHISAANAREYYRLRNHSENVSRKPQTAEQDFLKALLLARTVIAGTEPGARRDTLLERPMVGSAGLVLPFGKRFASLPAAQQEDLVARAQELAPGWSEGLRALAPPHIMVMLDLLFARNIDDLRTLSAQLSKRAPLSLAAVDGTVAWVGEHQKVTGLTPTVTASIDRWEADDNGKVFDIEGYAQANVTSAPDTCALTWQLREASGELRVPVDVTAVAVGDGTVRFDFHSRTPLDELAPRGTWDAHLELGWGVSTVRLRLGDRRPSAPKGRSVRVSNARGDVLFLTEYGNVSVDAGGLRKHTGEASEPVAPAPASLRKKLGKARRSLFGR